MKVALVVIGVIVLAVLAVFGWAAGSRNTLVTEREAVNAAWAQVDVALQRRADLIPNLVETVKGFAKQEQAVIKEVTDARAALGGARTPAEKIQANGQLDGALSRLLDFVDRLESAVQSADLPRLAADTAELREFAESLELDTRDDFARLRQKMIEIQRRLHEVELLATLDPLTGVANRRDLDRELAARIVGRQEFCVLLFDLNGFKDINDCFGHLIGDQVLKQLAARLSSQVRARDYVCRWGGDEFVAILACDLAIAESRSRQIAERLNGPYQIMGEGREIRVDIAVTVGLAQYCAGESPEQLFRRVDASMYRQKHSSFPDG